MPSYPTDLEPTPDHAGAGYYAQFPVPAAAGWSDPGHFPIGAWYMLADTPEQIAIYRGLGFNFTWEINDLSDLARFREAGMSAVVQTNKLLGLSDEDANALLGSETVGLTVADEPDMTYRAGWDAWTGVEGWGQCSPAQDEGGKCGYTMVTTRAEQTTRYGGGTDRLRFVDLGYGIFPGVMPDTDFAEFTARTYGDVLALNLYWFNDPLLDADSAGPSLLEGSGTPPAEWMRPPLLPHERKRAWNYGQTHKRLRALTTTENSPATQPIMGFVEVAAGTARSSDMPTGPELQAAVMSLVIAGADGIVYFQHDYGGAGLEGRGSRAPLVDQQHLNAAAVGEINHVLHDLAPTLNTAPLQWDAGPGIESRLSVHDGTATLMAMTTKAATGEHTIQLPAALADADTVTVYGEDRTAPVVDGEIVDDFPTPNTWHIYQLSVDDAPTDPEPEPTMAVFPNLTLTPTPYQDGGYAFTTWFRPSTDQWVTAVRYHNPSGNPFPGARVALFQNGLTTPLWEQADVTLPPGDGEWVLPDPVRVFAGTRYMALVWGPEGIPYTSTATTLPLDDGTLSNSEFSGAYSATWMGSWAVTPELVDSGYHTSPNWNGVSVEYAATIPTDPDPDPDPEPVEDTTAPSVPAGVSTGTITQTTAHVTWAPSTDDTAVTGYRVLLDGAIVASPSSTGHTLTGLTAGTGYTVTVAAGDGSGNWSAASAPVMVTTMPASPDPDPDPEPEPSEPGGVWWGRVGTTWHPITGTTPNPGGTARAPHEHHVADYGAVGDGTTDDTAAIQAAIQAAIAAAPDHNGVATIVFDATTYLIASPPRLAEHGHAQLVIPYIPGSTADKVVLTFRGACDVAAPLYWDQPTAQVQGTVLKSGWTTGSSDGGAYGAPAVLGGPTNLAGVPQDNFGTFSNMHVVIDGIQVAVPYGRPIGGFNFRTVGCLTINSAAVFPDVNRLQSGGLQTHAYHPDSYGLIMPQQGNNALVRVGAFTAYGVALGALAGEHLQAGYLCNIYCGTGLAVRGGNTATWPDGTPRTLIHTHTIDHLLNEATATHLANYGATTQIVATMGGELREADASISDPDDLLSGEIRWQDVYDDTPRVVGARRLRVVSDGVTRGPRTDAPAVPASGVALVNPWWRDATVYLTGTITDAAVDGVALGARTEITVPTGATITLTYPDTAPTWVWVLH